MEKFLSGVVITLGVVFFCGTIFFSCVPSGRTVWNNYTYSLEKADENQYASKKKVEDTARAMISTYQTAVDTYNQYKDSDNEEKQNWAEQAKMQANRTANSYNEYILKNSHVWKNNIPSDIRHSLEKVE